jgi:glycosyltransferase involved in cell wall biosynthesis
VSNRTVIFLIESEEQSRSRIRTSSLLEPLGKLGWCGQRIIFPGGLIQRFQMLSTQAPESVLVLPAHLYSGVTLRMMRTLCRALVLDLDDAIDCYPRDKALHADDIRRSGTRRRRFAKTLKFVDGVVCAGDYLKNKIHAAHPKLLQRLIPNPFEVLERRLDADLSAGSLRLLWIGSRATLCYLEQCLPWLERIAKNHSGLILRVVCDAFPGDREGLTIERIDWSPEAERAALLESDIGLMPLDRHPWSLGKSGFKLMQYMGAGIPVISVPHGNGRFLLPDDYPYFAETFDQFQWAIGELGASRTRRKEWGLCLQAEIRKRFLPSIVAQLWTDFLNELWARTEK